MRPVQGGRVCNVSTVTLSSRLQRGLAAQAVVLVALLTSTAVVTRLVVLSSVDAESSFAKVPDFHVTDCTPRSRDGDDQIAATYIDSRFHDEERDPGRYVSYRDALDTTTATCDLHGYIISMKKERYEHAASVLSKLRITPHHYLPFSYDSQLVWDEMEKYNNGTVYHKDIHNLKMFSHRMAHTGMLFDFVNDARAKMNSWRFFFEDDIEIHPSVAPEDVRRAVTKGLEIGAADGMIYLGLCGPGRIDSHEPPIVVAPGVTARRSHGTCTHAYALTKWRAAGLLSVIDTVEVPKDYTRVAYLYYDILTRAYGVTVTKAFVVGFNLRTPVPQEYLGKQAHVGLVFQDRVKYASFISPTKAKTNVSRHDPLRH